MEVERANGRNSLGASILLVVHFPIALFLLVPILELAGRNARFSFLRLSTGFVLGIATLAATVAALLGWCLARSGGYSGPLLQQHMWGGIALAGLCWLCWLLRTRNRGSGFLYAATALLALVWSHGPDIAVDNFL